MVKEVEENCEVDVKKKEKIEVIVRVEVLIN